MKGVLDLMRKRLSQQYRGKNIIGSIAIQEVRDFFQIDKKAEDIVRENELIEGYLKNDKLFIKTSDLEIKIQIFKQKKELIQLINDKFQSLGYSQQISDIYTK